MRLFALAFVVAATGCYQISADVQGLSASAGEQSFDGAGAAAGQPIAIDRMLEFAGQPSLASLVDKVHLESVTLTPTSGVSSLAFVSSLALTLHAPTGDVPLVDASGSMAGADGAITLPVHADVDPALLAQALEIAANVDFVAPAAAWSMRVDAALSVEGHADLHP